MAVLLDRLAARASYHDLDTDLCDRIEQALGMMDGRDVVLGARALAPEFADRVEEAFEVPGSDSSASPDEAKPEPPVSSEIQADAEAKPAPGHVKAARATKKVVSNLICKSCGNHVASNAHREKCGGPPRKSNNRKSSNGKTPDVEPISAEAARAMQDAAVEEARAIVADPPTLSRKAVEGCPKCGGRIGQDGDGDTVCMTCGWRQVAGESILAELARAEVEAEPGQHRRRQPSIAGMKL